jgi:hypothetical protein
VSRLRSSTTLTELWVAIRKVQGQATISHLASHSAATRAPFEFDIRTTNLDIVTYKFDPRRITLKAHYDRPNNDASAGVAVDSLGNNRGGWGNRRRASPMLISKLTGQSTVDCFLRWQVTVRTRASVSPWTKIIFMCWMSAEFSGYAKWCY